MYQLYTIPASCSTGIYAFLKSLNLPFKAIKREDSPNYQALVPTNQVPALQDEELLITEGAAIVLHLLDKHNIDLEALGGANNFRQWLMFNYATLHPAYSKLLTINQHLEDSPIKQAVMAELAVKVTNLWKIIDKRLEANKYIMGDNVTIIDYLLAVYLNWGNFFNNIHIPVGKNVLRLIEHVSTLPEFIYAYEQEGVVHSIPKQPR